MQARMKIHVLVTARYGVSQEYADNGKVETQIKFFSTFHVSNFTVETLRKLCKLKNFNVARRGKQMNNIYFEAN